jgi:hypothetical protein
MSRVAEEPSDPGVARVALKDLDESIGLTPRDPSASVLRAFVRLGAEDTVDLALEDLSRALELDRLHTGARGLLNGLAVAARTPRFPMLSPTASFCGADRKFMGLASRFALEE